MRIINADDFAYWFGRIIGKEKIKKEEDENKSN